MVVLAKPQDPPPVTWDEPAGVLFVLTNPTSPSYVGPMSLERTIRIVQVSYPQVYLACHTRHQRKKTTEYQLSARDSSILAHLDQHAPTTPVRLAAHLGVARSTLSEALKRLTAMGYTATTKRAPQAGTRGGIGVVLSAKGAKAIRETSVLETPRLKAVLGQLTPAELRAVARGMTVLANACALRSTAGHKPTGERS